jgi:hypothetical protein
MDRRSGRRWARSARSQQCFALSLERSMTTKDFALTETMSKDVKYKSKEKWKFKQFMKKL